MDFGGILYSRWAIKLLKGVLLWSGFWFILLSVWWFSFWYGKSGAGITKPMRSLKSWMRSTGNLTINNYGGVLRAISWPIIGRFRSRVQSYTPAYPPWFVCDLATQSIHRIDLSVPGSPWRWRLAVNLLSNHRTWRNTCRRNRLPAVLSGSIPFFVRRCPFKSVIQPWSGFTVLRHQNTFWGVPHPAEYLPLEDP